MKRMDTPAGELVEALNTYDGDNLWEDIVWAICGPDDVDTKASDRAGALQYGYPIALRDGSAVIYDEARGTWYVA